MSDAAERAKALRERRRRERAARPVTLDEVLRRNYVERIKKQRAPLTIIDDLDRLATTPYEEIPEEDILRLQWHGLYHDKPKVGLFMMRVKIPGGILTPAKLRVLGELACRYGENRAELTTRQDVQLHSIRLGALPEIFQTLAQAGLSTRGGCGDVLRNITSCPVAGVDAEELFDVRPLVAEAHRRYSGNPDYGDLPRKHKWTIGACAYHCNAPEIHDIALVGTMQDGQRGFAVWVGGGLSTVPRIARSLGVFVAWDEALDVAETLMGLWRDDLRYRMSRAKARFKFMVDDYGPEKLREMLEARLGRRLQDLHEDPAPKGRTDHMGIHVQRDGQRYIGFPVFAGLMRGEQMIRVASIAEAVGAEIRLTREQNLVLVNVPEERVDEVVQRMADEAQLSLDVSPLRGHSIGCTGDPHCNFAVGQTKPKLIEIVQHLEATFGSAAADLRIYLDGCPHACGQHWVGDIGLQGTTLSTPEGKVPAYDILLRGGLGPQKGIAKAVVRRVRHDEVKYCVERLVRAYLEQRRDGETPQEFFRRLDDETLNAVARGEQTLSQPAA